MRAARIAALAAASAVVLLASTAGAAAAGGGGGIAVKPRPVPATVLREITHVPGSTYDAVGTGIPGDNAVPSVLTGKKALTFDGKPGVLGMFGEFCPYCAAQRWAVVASLSRFGTFTGLRTMQSSPITVDPKTQTFEFRAAKYTSPYIAAKLLEAYGQEKSTGSKPQLSKPDGAELAVITKYDPKGTMPFVDVGNEVVFVGASYTPKYLRGLSRATIAASLKDPTRKVTKLILGASNYLSAAVCSLDGGKPASVCTSSGVRAAAKVLEIRT